MNRPLVEKVVRAVLYEGYMLYPYRPSALKNQKRCHFGVIYPRDYSEAERGAEPSIMQTECLAITTASSILDVEIRFLQADGPACIERQVHVRDVGLATISFPNISGSVEVTAAAIAHSVVRIRVRVLNETPFPNRPCKRDDVLGSSLLSTHVILHLQDGEFISLIDPPEHLREFTSQCVNVGTWPVLIGASGDRDCMLSSPIILYDYPQIAADTDGDLFDCTEIDEMLNLRIQTLADFEKDEMRNADPRTREILERVSCRGLAAGHRVRLQPKAGADIFDIALAGRTATIESIEQDFEGRIHVAVVLDDDPGRDLGFLRQPGHRFFFAPDEVEPIA
jgi:hypothetical protein